MIDPRCKRLADLLIRHSTALKPGDKCLIDVGEIPPEMTVTLVEAVSTAGALPFVWSKDSRVQRALLSAATPEQMDIVGNWELALMKQMDAYIALRAGANSLELSDVPTEGMRLYREKVWQRVHSNERLTNTRWCVLRWPSPGMAQQAGMSTGAFEDFYFDVCVGVDYEKMGEAQKPLAERIEAADRVRILGPGETDLQFSVKGLGAVMCHGLRNIPDGECYTAPVKESVNGVIHYNAPSSYNDRPFDDIRLVFRDGRVVEATSSDTAALNEILDTDEGARYVGEFSFGFNPFILKPMRDTLFDEKIAGSIHFTPGNAYEECDNGNRSAVHWDIVLIQRPEYGGGEIWFDDDLIRKDGLFVPEDLQGLNPDNLKAA
jgi:aminopeptidase